LDSGKLRPRTEVLLSLSNSVDWYCQPLGISPKESFIQPSGVTLRQAFGPKAHVVLQSEFLSSSKSTSIKWVLADD